MLYKHWKKIALTMTALFWASCDDTSTSSGANGEQSSSSSIVQSSSERISSSSSDIDESSSSFELPVPAYGGFPVYCYNDTAVNDSGKVFDIVVCDNGEKYLRFQSLYMDIPEKQKELPKGVNPVPPAPDSIYARNCTREPDICIDAFTIDENGNEKPVGGCYPSIDCPEKPET
jgi:hypothetical protein